MKSCTNWKWVIESLLSPVEKVVRQLSCKGPGDSEMPLQVTLSTERLWNQGLRP